MIRHLYIGLCLASIVLAASCSPHAPAPVAPPQLTVLDQLLQPEDVKARVKAAEQDLPDDEWRSGGETRPGRHNISRSSREGHLAHELLSSLGPRLNGMSPRQLLDQLKLFPYSDYGSFAGVAYYIYRDGNEVIVGELKTKGASELDSLRGFRGDTRWVFTGDNGRPLTVSDLVRYTLLHEPL
jgi:hypothetical protein